MKTQVLTISLALAAALLWGCEQGPSSTQEGSGQTTTEAVKQMADSAMTTAKEQSAAVAESATEMADAAIQEAQGLIDQAAQYINEGRLDLAEGIMAQLASLRDSLPASIQEQIDNLQNLFATKQTAEEATQSAAAGQQLLPGQNQ